MTEPHPTSAPVHTWLAEKMPADVRRSIDRIAAMDDVQHVAVMPDVHLAEDVCVGTVIATTRLIYPAAVGGDIGCGMLAAATNVGADALRSRDVAMRVLSELSRAVPSIKHRSARDAPSMPRSLVDRCLSCPSLDAVRRRDGTLQFATLGRGNHFLELQSDEAGQLWIMIHSGSRAMGQAIRGHHARETKLSGLDARSLEGRAYLFDSVWARAYAKASRRAMLDATERVLHDVIGARIDERTIIDCDHNHVAAELHFGQEWFVHRKGACPAGDGVPGIIPGSMGTRSFHTLGRGEPRSLCSSSHGAGRAMSRTDAKRRISSREFERQMQGVWFDPRLASQLREEAPSAYKDVREVMRVQRDLTRIVRELRPVLIYKGV